MRDRASRGRVLAVVTAFALLILSAAPAHAAEDVTAATLRDLAARADRDPAARQELSQVRRVDGKPVDIGTALAGASEDERRARLRTLAKASEAPARPTPDAATAREDAHRILESRRFNPVGTPRPFQGALRRLGEWLSPVLRPLARLWGAVTRPGWPAGLAGAVVVLSAVALAVRMVRRRTTAAVGGGGGGNRRRGDDPVDLERLAAEAEARGDLDGALRLRFRAGLVRLDAAGAVKLRPSLTTGELTRRVPSEDLQELAVAFEAVAYAGEHADAGDVEAAKRQWPLVLEQAGRR